MDVTHYNSTSAAKIGREAPLSITFNIYVDEATWLDIGLFSHISLLSNFSICISPL